MPKLSHMIVLAVGLCLSPAVAPAQTGKPCPGYNAAHNTNLACEIPTALHTGLQTQNSLRSLTPTLATQLSQLPNVTVISGSGLTFSKSLGVIGALNESLGTIMTQRGETIGRHQWYVSLSYQHFAFDSIDAISLKNIPTVLCVVGTCGSAGSAGATVFDTIERNRIDLLIHQVSAVGSFGLTKRMDVSVVVPFSQVILKIGTGTPSLAVQGQTTLFPINGTFLAGSATGVDDVSVNLKANMFNGEYTKIAIGGEVRLPTGDATNLLGTGAYGVKPYFVLSRNGKITPNINLGYQWNGPSVLSINGNLPSSFLYSGGIDYSASRRLTLNIEFIGQAIVNGPRLVQITAPTPAGSFPSVASQTGTYAMDNVGVGLRCNPYRGLLITANALFAADKTGLRSKIVPLIGASYKF